jgi:hypothetical protein
MLNAAGLAFIAAAHDGPGRWAGDVHLSSSRWQRQEVSVGLALILRDLSSA